MSVFPFTLETLETLFTVRQESHDPYVAGCVAAARPYRGLATLDATEGRVQGQTILGILWLSYQDVPWILRFCKAKVRSSIGLYIWKPGFLCSVHLHNILATRF